MSPIDVLCLPGTFERDGEPISDAFMQALNPALFNPVYVDYPATYGDPPYGDSRDAGRANVLAAAQARYPDPVYLYGYSQGAAGAAKAANDAGRGVVTGVNILGCALMADPHRPAHRVPVLGSAGGYGIAGERDVESVPTWWAAVADDPITSLPAGNPLRSIADLTEYWSAASAAAALRWMASVLEKAYQGKLQPWWSWNNRGDWDGAIIWALNYLVRQRHTTAYITEGHAVALAGALNDHAG